MTRALFLFSASSPSTTTTTTESTSKRFLFETSKKHFYISFFLDGETYLNEIPSSGYIYTEDDFEGTSRLGALKALLGLKYLELKNRDKRMVSLSSAFLSLLSTVSHRSVHLDQIVRKTRRDHSRSRSARCHLHHLTRDYLALHAAIQIDYVRKLINIPRRSVLSLRSAKMR